MIAYFELGDCITWNRDTEPGQKKMTLSLRFVKEFHRNGNKQAMVAEDIRRKKKYFVKILFCDDVEQIFVEKESKAQLFSPFIVRIYGGMLLEERRCFITLMEYLPHEDLSSLIRNHHLEGKNQTERLRICNQIALRFLHGIDHYMSAYQQDPIVHRDLKPENVICSPDGTFVKIIDFDWVHLHDSTVTIMQKHQQKGTPGYAEPAYWNSYLCKPEMDIYSAGLVLYFLYTGKHHFYGNAEIQRYLVDREYAYTLKDMPGIPEEIVAILARMIAPEEIRYKTIGAVINDFTKMLRDRQQEIMLKEVLAKALGDDALRLTYRVGDVRYSPYVQENRFVTIDYGRKQERSQNGDDSDEILAFYRYHDSIRYIILNENCRLIRSGAGITTSCLYEGDLFLYNNTEIEIMQIRRKR